MEFGELTAFMVSGSKLAVCFVGRHLLCVLRLQHANTKLRNDLGKTAVSTLHFWHTQQEYTRIAQARGRLPFPKSSL